ncbi:MAG TPA: prolyl oligopeptidase family serine peptidase, partial [Chitinophagaceae bacterium]|nr:prolyl oligopeptidase family serine peptidase [Chitinophagaceae bacterium]
SAKTEFQKIFFHKIGTSQSADVLIYEDKQNPLIYKGAALSEDQRWLMLNLAQGTDGTELQFMDLKDKNQKKFKVLCPGFSNNYDFVTNIDGRFLIYTNFEAPNYRLVWMDPAHPEPEHWKDFLPEASQKLDAVHRVGDRIFCSYLINANTQVNVYDLNGTVLSTIELPALGTASGFEGSEKDDITFYTFTSFNQPPVLYEYDLKSGRSTVFKSPSLKTDFNNTVVEQLWFTSRDGTRVPMFVYHRADVDLKKGPHPVLLYGYGGFNISLTPSFSIPMSYFVQKGGIYVSVSLRGGSEFGEKWHEAGMLDRKQNVFDDFIGAAEFLIKEGITRSDMLAIHGRSNGGLLVGACMTQRPDLFKVCLPGVGVLDMLRFHKFTVGWGWVVEYGSSDKESDFKFLYSYSPLHQLKKGTSYPATLITTAD